MRETHRVEQDRQLRMVVADQHVAHAVDQLLHALGHVDRMHPRHQLAVVRMQALEPVGEEGEHQRVRHRELQHLVGRRDRLVAVEQRARGIGVAQQVGGDAAEQPAGGGQGRGVHAAVHEFDAQPFLQRHDAAAEGRLRDVAIGGGTGKAARFGEAQKVLEPLRFHEGGAHCTDGRDAVHGQRSYALRQDFKTVSTRGDDADFGTGYSENASTRQRHRARAACTSAGSSVHHSLLDDFRASSSRAAIAAPRVHAFNQHG